MKEKLLSIIMPVYNHAQYLNESIQSVISQTYKNWELIIIDDGSSDNSFNIARDYACRFPDTIKLYNHQNRENRGIVASYKLGLDLYQGQYIGFLEPDDIWIEDNARMKINILQSVDIGLIYSDVQPIGMPEIINMRRWVIKSYRSVNPNMPFKAPARLLSINFIPPFSAVIVKRETMEHIKINIPRDYGIWLDWFIWIQASFKVKFFFIPKKLVKWRLHANSYCTKSVLKKGFVNMLIFELKYRGLLFSELILPYKGNNKERLKIFFLFFSGFIKRFFVFIYRGWLDFGLRITKTESSMRFNN